MTNFKVGEYEKNDYERAESGMSIDEVIQCLYKIERIWLPDYNLDGSKEDFDIYKIHIAIYKAIRELKELYIKNTTDIEIFYMACEDGCLKRVKRLYDSRNMNDRVCNIAFIIACKNGQLKIAKWLFSKANIYIRADEDRAFWAAYENGHSNIVKWISSKYCNRCHSINFQLTKKNGNERRTTCRKSYKKGKNNFQTVIVGAHYDGGSGTDGSGSGCG